MSTNPHDGLTAMERAFIAAFKTESDPTTPPEEGTAPKSTEEQFAEFFTRSFNR